MKLFFSLFILLTSSLAFGKYRCPAGQSVQVRSYCSAKAPVKQQFYASRVSYTRILNIEVTQSQCHHRVSIRHAWYDNEGTIERVVYCKRK